MNFLFVDDFGQIQWKSIAILIFAFVFLVMGILRLVEFTGMGLTKVRQGILMTFHLVGCGLFTAAFVLGAINLYQDERPWMYGCFISAMVFLAPGQFIMGMIRKRKLQEAYEAQKKSG